MSRFDGCLNRELPGCPVLPVALVLHSSVHSSRGEHQPWVHLPIGLRKSRQCCVHCLLTASLPGADGHTDGHSAGAHQWTA